MKFPSLRRRRRRAPDKDSVPVRSGKGWTPAEIIEAIRLWHAIYGQPPRWVEWTPCRARARGVQVPPTVDLGLWPTGRQVTRRFGTWNRALLTAGLQPRPAHRPKAA